MYQYKLIEIITFNIPRQNEFPDPIYLVTVCAALNLRLIEVLAQLIIRNE